jgi:hypothetical protein
MIDAGITVVSEYLKNLWLAKIGTVGVRNV